MSKNNIITRENSAVQTDFFPNPVQIHSNGEQGCCSLFFPPPPPPPLSLITRPQRKAPPFYSPQKGRGETCASVSAASFCCSAASPLLCIPTPLSALLSEAAETGALGGRFANLKNLYIFASKLRKFLPKT